MTTDITELAQLRAELLSPAIGSSAHLRKIALSLVEALEKAQQEAEELSKFKEVMTSAAEALKAGSPLNLESLFKGELASAMFAMMLAGEFIRSGATNYLELLYDVPEFGEMTVTLQKVEGKTPGQRIAELEESNAQVIQSRDHYKRMTEEGLKQLAESRTVTDWIEHDGKWRPESLGLDELVYLKTRKQELKIPYPAGKVKGWMNTGGDMDVMAYKLASPQASTITVKLTDINEYLAEVHDKTLNRALRLLAEGVRAGDVAAMRAAGIKVEAE